MSAKDDDKALGVNYLQVLNLSKDNYNFLLRGEKSEEVKDVLPSLIVKNVILCQHFLNHLNHLVFRLFLHLHTYRFELFVLIVCAKRLL